MEQAVPANKIMEAIKGTPEEAKALEVNVAPAASVPPPSADSTKMNAAKPSSPPATAAPPPSADFKVTAAKPSSPLVSSHGSGKGNSGQESAKKQAEGTFEPRVGDKSTPVFISYQSAYTERVLKIKRALEARGIPCWMATENMVGNVQDAIGEALMVAPAIIICFSHSYRDSV